MLFSAMPWAAAAPAAAETISVSNEKSDDISVIDVANREVVKSITVGHVPLGRRRRTLRRTGRAEDAAKGGEKMTLSERDRRHA